MSVADPEWSKVQGEIELSARLCCSLTGICTLGAWDLKTMEIWNLESNPLSLIGNVDN